MGICKFQGMLVRSGDKVHESFLFPPHGFWELISGPWDWLQMPLAVEPSHQTLNLWTIFILYVRASICYDTSEEVWGQLRRWSSPYTFTWILGTQTQVIRLCFFIYWATVCLQDITWLKHWYIFRNLKCTTTLTKWCQWRKKQIIPKMTVKMSNR